MIKWFYIEDNQPDNDPATSEGMYVYKKDANVAVGDLIQVDGVVEEYVGPGYAERFDTDLTTTEIKSEPRCCNRKRSSFTSTDCTWKTV